MCLIKIQLFLVNGGGADSDVPSHQTDPIIPLLGFAQKYMVFLFFFLN